MEYLFSKWQVCAWRVNAGNRENVSVVWRHTHFVHKSTSCVYGFIAATFIPLASCTLFNVCVCVYVCSAWNSVMTVLIRLWEEYTVSDSPIAKLISIPYSSYISSLKATFLFYEVYIRQWQCNGILMHNWVFEVFSFAKRSRFQVHQL